MDRPLTLRRASVSRKGGVWKDDDFDVFDGDRRIGRMHRVNASTEIWFWGFDLTGRKSYAENLNEAKAMFQAEYERWLKGG
jgi:hypothetical protein